MKVIIAGGRDYLFDSEDTSVIDKLHKKYRFTEVVSGCARGADSCGITWAIENEIPVKKFPAKWNTYGRSAGMIRNRQMAEYADAVILFPGGVGTDNMYVEAVGHGLRVFDYRTV